MLLFLAFWGLVLPYKEMDFFLNLQEETGRISFSLISENHLAPIEPHNER